MDDLPQLVNAFKTNKTEQPHHHPPSLLVTLSKSIGGGGGSGGTTAAAKRKAAAAALLELSREESNAQEMALFTDFLDTVARELERCLRDLEVAAWDRQVAAAATTAAPSATHRRRPLPPASLVRLTQHARKLIHAAVLPPSAADPTTMSIAHKLLQTLAELSKDEFVCHFVFYCSSLVDTVMEFAAFTNNNNNLVEAATHVACLTLLGNVALEPAHKRSVFVQCGMIDLLMMTPTTTTNSLERVEVTAARLRLHRILAMDPANSRDMVIMTTTTQKRLVEGLLHTALQPSAALPHPALCTLARISLGSMLLPLCPQPHQHHYRVHGGGHSGGACARWQAALAAWTLLGARTVAAAAPISRLPVELVRLVFSTLC